MFDGARWRCGVALAWALAVGSVMSACVSTYDVNSPDPVLRRQAVMEISRKQPADAVPLLSGALNDTNAVVRRAAARGLRAMGAPAAEALDAALRNPDPEVRMTAFLGLNDLGALRQEHLAAAIKDKESMALRLSATQIVVKMPQTKETKELLETASKDESGTIREVAAKALNPFPFFRKVESIRDHADQVVNVIQTIALPADGWKLKFDSGMNGHALKWFDPAMKDADWTPVSIGKFWDDFGFKGKTGIGWYRGRFTLPEKPRMNAVELGFGAVDETAWVWINGEYAGQHDIGPNGWDVPFRLDITPFLKWGAENQITVRVLNTAQGGGIWKPVTLEIIRLGN